MSINRPMKDNEVSSEHYCRDNGSGALLSVDHAGLAAYKRRVAMSKRSRKNISEMSDDINSLKEEFQEMKDLLNQFMNSLKQK